MIFSFKNKTYERMLCIYKINKLFDMIPRLKYYKDIINVTFVDFSFKFYWATNGQLTFHSDMEMH